MSITIFGDWGTSRLRLFRMAGDRVVERSEGPGIGVLEGSPEEALRSALAGLRRQGETIDVVLCGMAGSRNGLVEVPYAECPATPAEWRARAVKIEAAGAAVTVMPGLACTTAAGAPDVMRGEETQIFGAIAADPALGRGRHIVALPGTHSKWAEIEDGAVVRFRTFLTGELFALLERQSTLTRAGDDDSGTGAGFEAGLARARSDHDLLGALFTARSAQLREERSRGWATGYLSGLLIGHEIAAAAAGVGKVTLIGAPALTASYVRALDGAGVAADVRDGDACAIAGLMLDRSGPLENAACR